MNRGFQPECAAGAPSGAGLFRTAGGLLERLEELGVRLAAQFLEGRHVPPRLVVLFHLEIDDGAGVPGSGVAGFQLDGTVAVGQGQVVPEELYIVSVAESEFRLEFAFG